MDFILTQLSPSTTNCWPRTIATKSTNATQIPVSNKHDAMTLYKDANYMDCRISAYPYVEDKLQQQKQIINFVLIDMDLSDFNYSKPALDKELAKILKRIEKLFEYTPTVICSGNGYHIYIQLEPIEYILEDKPEFAKYTKPSKECMAFVEKYLSNYKCDKVHNSTMSFSNCMLRVPGSINSKHSIRHFYVGEYTDAEAAAASEVRIKQVWDQKSHFPLKLLMGDFMAYLLDSNTSNYRGLTKSAISTLPSRNGNSTFIIDWIEILLKLPLQDYRKYCIWRILAPYLINKRQLGYDKAYTVIEEWLQKCEELEPLDFDLDYKINEGLDGAENTGCYPIAFKDLKDENPDLFQIIWDKIIHKRK